MDWWVFAEGTEFEAREYLARFLEEGAAAAAAGFGSPDKPVLADFSLASVPEVLAVIGRRVELVEVSPPAKVPAWVQAVLDQNSAGFRDFAEVSRPLVLHAAYYLGASFVTSYPVLRWDIGREDRPEVHQPVVTGFGSGEDMPVLAVAEAALQAGDPGAAVREWRHAVWVGQGVPRVRAAVEVPGLASEAEALWYDAQRWPAWVDGFGHVAKLEGEWPGPGARAVWDSRPGGRGRVVERVTAYEARSGQTLAVEDEKLRGTQTVTFEPGQEGVMIALALEYEIKAANLFTPLVDALFIRRALRESLQRSLNGFARELRGDRELLS